MKTTTTQANGIETTTVTTGAARGPSKMSVAMDRAFAKLAAQRAAHAARVAALTAAEMVAADPYASWPADARAAQMALDAKRAAAQANRPAVLAASKAAAAVAVLAKAPAGSVVCPCCGRAVTVKGGRIVRHGFKGAKNGYTSGANATGMTVNGAQTKPCEGTGRAA